MSVAIHASGMTTAIGLTAPATCAALRARLDNFTETRFISRDGVWVMGAEVPLENPWRGIARLVELLAGPIAECLEAIPDTDPETIPLMLCVAERDRPGRPADLDEKLPQLLAERLGFRLHRASKVIAFGQVGAAVGLRDARDLLGQGASHVIVAGVDSLLNAETIRHFERQDRLYTEENSNGFFPSEAGAAVLVGHPSPGTLTLTGLGFGGEEARLGSGKPLRAEGLVTAMRQSLEEAGIELGGIDYIVSGLTGEQYYFKEYSLAKARLLRGPRDLTYLWHPADAAGHTGAASIPIMLGVCLTAGRKSYAPGPVAMVQSAHDDGRRAAMVFRMDG